MSILRETHSLYEPLSMADGLRIFGRVTLGNFAELVDAIPSTPGRVLDFGCGHGVLLNLLRARGKITAGLGVDIDERKIALAREKAGPGLEFDAAPLESVSGSFEAAFACDVFYVIPLSEWEPIFRRLHDLVRPEGRLIIKTVFKKPNWKHVAGSLQEVLAVRGLGITRSSGRGFVYLSPEDWKSRLTAWGWDVEICRDLRGLLYNHGLLICRRKN